MGVRHSRRPFTEFGGRRRCEKTARLDGAGVLIVGSGASVCDPAEDSDVALRGGEAPFASRVEHVFAKASRAALLSSQLHGKGQSAMERRASASRTPPNLACWRGERVTWAGAVVSLLARLPAALILPSLELTADLTT